MNHALLWILHLALTLCAFAAALTWAGGLARRAARGLALTLGLLPLVPLAYGTWLALRLRSAWIPMRSTGARSRTRAA